MAAICKREFCSLFQNVIGWLFIAAIMALFGLYFFIYNLVYGAPSIIYTLSGLSIIVLVAVPILTMRVLAEEKRNKTDQLILTAPVSVWQIVCGKFLALAGAFSICVGVMALTPLLLSIFGKVKMAESYVALLGFFLFGLTCIAIGMFVSSLTESQVISAVVTFILLFIGFIMSSVVDAVFKGEGIAAKILGAYDLMTPLDDLQKGALNFVSIVYYVSMTVLFLFLTTQSIEKRRWTVSARKLSANAFSVTTIVVVIAAMVGLNIGMAMLPEDVTVRDVTPQKLYSISQETKDYIRTLEDDVKIYVIGTKSDLNDQYPELVKMLSRYDDGAKHIKVKYVDTEKNPTFASAYSDSDLSAGSVIVESKKRFKVLAPSQIYSYDFDYTTYSQTLSAFDGEGQVTGALQYVLSDNMPVAYELTGHDEVPLGENFMTAMEKANLDVKSLNFLETAAVPEDAAFVIINAPQGDLSSDDVNKLLSYVKGGGQLFIALDFGTTAGLSNLAKVLDHYGVTQVEGVVAEMDPSYYYQNNFYLLPEVIQTECTMDVAGTMSVFAPFSVGLTYPEADEDEDAADEDDGESSSEGSDAAENAAPGEDAKPEFTYTALMKTSDEAITKKDYASTESMGMEGIFAEIKKEDGDIEGPFTLGLQVHLTGGGNSFIFGSTYLFTDAADGMVSGRNTKLFAGVISAMSAADETETAAIVIPAKSYEADNILVNANIARMYGLLLVFAVPAILLVTGIVIWYKRRKQ
ncbi:MAG: Gldg family protein [Lachnospiraceae bacterium]|nr:Gldg family protein [Lachnospiraceae bacterium]